MMLGLIVLMSQMLLRPVSPAGVWFESERPTFSMEEGHSRFYRVTDFYGNVRERGACPDDEKTMSVGLLGPGCYALKVFSGTNEIGKTSFTVLPERVAPGERDPEAFFGTMATFARKPNPTGDFGSWCHGDVDDIVSRVLSMAGLTEARVMWWWDRLERNKGVFDSEAWDRASSLYRSRGIGLCAFGHSCPDWVSRSGRLPRDLSELVRFCRRMERTYGSAMTAWEFGNEPESARFVPEGAWHFAAVSKAAYLAFKAENPNRLVASAAFCTKAGSSGVDTLWYESGGAYYTDFLNLHDYEIEPVSARYVAWRNMLSRYGVGSQAIWVTENGTDLEGEASVRGPDGKYYHDEGQEAVHAEAGIKGELRLMQEGVSRCYHFYLSKFHEREGKKDWGDFRSDGTLKPYFAAHATAARELKGATLLGRVCPGVGLTGYLFSRPEGLRTLMYWSESDVDRLFPGDYGRTCVVNDIGNMYKTNFFLRVGAGFVRRTLMTGESRSQNCSDERISIVATRYPAYVTGRFDMPLAEQARPRGCLGARRPEPGLDLSVVIRADESPDDFRTGSGRTRAEMLKDRGLVRFEVWNLSDMEKRGTLSWQGADLTGVPGTLLLPPWGKASFDAEINYDNSWSNALAKLEVRGVFNGCMTTPFVLPLFSERHFLDGRKCIELDGWRDPGQWRKNDSGCKTSIVWDEGENAIRVDVEFDPKTSDCWMFPRLFVKGCDLAQAAGLVFEIKASQTRVENQWKATMVQLEPPQDRCCKEWLRFRSPVEQWEQRSVDFGGRQLCHIDSLCIGGLPVVSRKATIWIRGIKRVIADAPDVQSDAEKYFSTEMNSCQASATTESHGGRRLLVLGNSIALHGVAPKIGWTNHWGMAASIAENDFAHLVWSGLERATGDKYDCRIRNVYDAEKVCGRGWNPSDRLKDEIKWAPDVVVIALGENVPNFKCIEEKRGWEDFLVSVGEAFKQANKTVKIVYRTPFWPNEEKRMLALDAARRMGAFVADIGERGLDAAMQAGVTKFSHKGVAHHPGDAGMRMIADCILDSILSVRPDLPRPVYGESQEFSERLDENVLVRGIVQGSYLAPEGVLSQLSAEMSVTSSICSVRLMFPSNVVGKLVSELPIGWFSRQCGRMIVIEIPLGTGKTAYPDQATYPMPHDVPELMKAFDGTVIGSVEDWERIRRPELMDFYRDKVFGRCPAERKSLVSFQRVCPDQIMMDGAALRKRINVVYRGDYGTNAFPFTAFIPRKKSSSVASFLLICNRDPGQNIDPERKAKSEFWPAEEIVKRGYAALAFYNGDLAPDYVHGNTVGAFTAFEDVTRRYRNESSWGLLACWAWGASRVLDWIETEPSLDAAKVAVVGHSRCGKAALYAGAVDQRFAMVCANDSGCCGMKLNHISLPGSERPLHTIRNRQNWYCLSFTEFANRECDMPVDAHCLAALIAPRRLCVGSASEDIEAGPLGEFWGALLASQAWELYGRGGLSPKPDVPAVQQPLQDGSISYHVRKGKHDLKLYDWNVYMDFFDGNN